MGTIAKIHEMLTSKQCSCTELTKSYLDEIEKQNGKKQKQFDWRASCRYTYYIVVKHLVPFEIAFTATIEPWVTVTSSNIDTDLEQ